MSGETTRDEAFARLDAADRKKARETAERQGFTMFARDGTPLPTIDTSEPAMRKNNRIIAFLLSLKKSS